MCCWHAAEATATSVTVMVKNSGVATHGDCDKRYQTPSYGLTSSYSCTCSTSSSSCHLPSTKSSPI
jgi:hypothetical protein